MRTAEDRRRPYARRRLATTAMLALVGAATAVEAAEGLKSYVKAGKYDDVRFELSTAIESRGLKVDFNGQIGQMLERTGADVGSTKPLYKAAEYFTFCSAKLSRAMMEADPANIGYCPYVVFVYEAAGKPGEVVVGYRRPPQSGNAASKAALAEIDRLLDDIVKEATK